MQLHQMSCLFFRRLICQLEIKCLSIAFVSGKFSVIEPPVLLIKKITIGLLFPSICYLSFALSALTLFVGLQEEHFVCKNWVIRCWCGYLSGARCKLFAYSPADAIAIPKPHHLLPHLNPDCFYLSGTVWARGRCRISPPRFLAECCKRQLNQVSLVLLYIRLSTFSDLYWVCLSVFSCTVLFVSISQVIGCEDRLRNTIRDAILTCARKPT